MFVDIDVSELTPKRSLNVILDKCDKEDLNSTTTDADQPLYADESCDKIKCKWCPSWSGSFQPRVINQHVRKSSSHQAARIKELKIPQPVQMDIRSFFSVQN